MAAVDLIATARNDEFAARVHMITYKVAQDVASEDPATANHDVRISYAQQIIRGDDYAKNIAAHVISSNPTISAAINAEPALMGANVPDSDIEFALASIWDARAISFAAAA